VNGIDTQTMVVAVLFFLLGWFGHIGWDLLCDWFFDMVDGTHSLLVDVFAAIGAVTVAVVIGYAVTH
jgi:hypothetical protein